VEYKKVRFSTFIQDAWIRHRTVNYNAVFKVRVERKIGLSLRRLDVYRLVRPYLQSRILEQCKAVIPLVLYLALFQILVLHHQIPQPWLILSGVLAVILGLMLFMEGLKHGLMPLGERIGHFLPRKLPLPVVLLIAFLLGVGVTFAEPAIGALKTAGSIVDVNQAPYLYAMLNDWADVLVMSVGAGVGVAVVIGTMRLLNGWSLKPFIYAALIPALLLSVYFMLDDELSKVIGLAWDCGAVTTGPVTVPLVLALGIGVAAASGKAASPLSGFGVVTLASIFPIVAVMLLALYVTETTTAAEIIAAAALSATEVPLVLPWYETSPGQEILSGMRAIVPLIVFLMIVLKVVLRERVSHLAITTYGVVLCVLGMIIFNLGLTFGLVQIGDMAGAQLPAAFANLDAVANSPLFGFAQGVVVAVVFAWLLGFGATLAEPALNALGQTVETLTQGSFRKQTLIVAVSIGVGFGIAIGVLKITFDVQLAYLLIPAYAIALLLTYFSSEEFVNIAWDSAGVTTGPITVPLVLAMGLGLGTAVNAVEGFGILSMASIGPIIAVLGTGLWVQWKTASSQDSGDVDEAYVLSEERA